MLGAVGKVVHVPAIMQNTRTCACSRVLACSRPATSSTGGCWREKKRTFSFPCMLRGSGHRTHEACSIWPPLACAKVAVSAHTIRISILPCVALHLSIPPCACSASCSSDNVCASCTVGTLTNNQVRLVGLAHTEQNTSSFSCLACLLRGVGRVGGDLERAELRARSTSLTGPSWACPHRSASPVSPAQTPIGGCPVTSCYHVCMPGLRLGSYGVDPWGSTQQALS